MSELECAPASLEGSQAASERPEDGPLIRSLEDRYPFAMPLIEHVAHQRRIKRKPVYIHDLSIAKDPQYAEVVELLAGTAAKGAIRAACRSMIFLLDGRRIIAMHESFAGTEALRTALEQEMTVKRAGRMVHLRIHHTQALEVLEDLAHRSRILKETAATDIPGPVSVRHAILELLAITPIRLDLEERYRTCFEVCLPGRIFAHRLTGGRSSGYAFVPPEQQLQLFNVS